jgi:hypothetical protein
MIFKIKINPVDNNETSYEEDFNTTCIHWTMNQYARNRKPFTWELIDYEETH